MSRSTRSPAAPSQNTVRKTGLPKYAKLIPPVFEKTLHEGSKVDPLSLAEEEAYLRTRAYHGLSQQLDSALETALSRSLDGSFESTLNCLLGQVALTDEKPREGKRMHGASSLEDHTHQNSKRARHNDMSANGVEASAELKDQDPITEDTRKDFSACAARYCVTPPCAFDPLLLPILSLQGPSHGLDRNAWMGHLVRTTMKTKPRTNVVWLRPAPGVDLSLQEELLRQCLTKEPSLSKNLRNRKFLEKSSVTETLIEWASTTTSYDEILVFLQFDDDEDFYDDVLQDIIRWLAERRSSDGLPIALVLLTPHVGRRSLELLSTAQGPGGILLKHFSLPRSMKLLDIFWENLYLEQQFDFSFPRSVLSILKNNFSFVNGSVVYVVAQMKSVLAHVLSLKGSFPLGARSRTMQCERDRIQWFLSDEKAMAAYCERKPKKVLLSNIDDLAAQEGEMRMIESELLMLVADTVSPSMFLSLSVSADEPLDLDTKRELMKVLASFWQRLDDFGSLNGHKLSNKTSLWTKQALRRFILCMDKFEKKSDLLKYFVPSFLNSKLCVGAFLPDIDSLVARMNIQPRRHVLELLLNMKAGTSSSTAINKTSPDLVRTAGLLYKLIQDRVSVLQSDWFLLFRQTFAIELTLSDAKEKFGYGVVHLKICGLVREKRIGSKNDIRYERSLFVWCSE